ncbi:hypothetical protein SAMN05421882_106117 [Nitrosomonas communis]|uniref:Uncharacterized protein n=1 Tax=Nitrosomonas communis TaxID=44574 RepID=A0A1H2YYX5_9PROT|nr:hypothetical protein SAMN05421882_106117 [Nitrosomonas communis]
MAIEQAMAQILKILAIDPDWEWEFIEGSYVKAH